MSLTKSTVITTLSGIYAEVCTPELLRTDAWNGKTKNTYQVNVLKVDNNCARFFNVVYYVISEGLAEEVAYFDYDRSPVELQV